MKLRTALGAAAGTLGATALANHLLRREGDAFDPFLSGRPGTYRWRGFDVHYVEAGDESDPDLVLLHGIHAAASNHEFERVFSELAADYHVIAPDLPGFGHSDRPPLLYSASLYREFVTDFLADLADRPVVVGSSLTGAYAAQAAGDVDVERLVLVCPTDDTMGDRDTWKRSLIRSPVLGQALFNLLASERSIRHFHLDHGYYDEANLSDDVVAYEWQSAHQPGARYAPASFVAGFLDPEESLADALARVDAPVTLVWGREAETTPVERGDALADETGAGLIVFERARLLPHVEHPDQFVAVVRGEYVDAEE